MSHMKGNGKFTRGAFGDAEKEQDEIQTDTHYDKDREIARAAFDKDKTVDKAGENSKGRDKNDPTDKA